MLKANQVLIKKSELNIRALLEQVALGNIDNKSILEDLEIIHEELISEGKNIILVSGPQGPQGLPGGQQSPAPPTLQAPQNLRINNQ